MADPNCKTKNLYLCKRLAKTVALDALCSRGVTLRVYWCVDCQGYHLTSKNAD